MVWSQLPDASRPSGSTARACTVPRSDSVATHRETEDFFGTRVSVFLHPTITPHNRQPAFFTTNQLPIPYIARIAISSIVIALRRNQGLERFDEELTSLAKLRIRGEIERVHLQNVLVSVMGDERVNAHRRGARRQLCRVLASASEILQSEQNSISLQKDLVIGQFGLEKCQSLCQVRVVVAH